MLVRTGYGQYVGTVGKGKTITYQGAGYSIQLYKKRKRADVPERTLYFDKDYYRFQYLDGGVTQLLRVNEVVATRRNDSVFVDDRIYRISYDRKYHAYDFKKDTSNVLTG